MHILNISADSIRLLMEYLPAGFALEDEVTFDMVFSDEVKSFIINTKAIISKIIPAEK